MAPLIIKWPHSSSNGPTRHQMVPLIIKWLHSSSNGPARHQMVPLVIKWSRSSSYGPVHVFKSPLSIAPEINSGLALSNNSRSLTFASLRKHSPVCILCHHIRPTRIDVILDFL